MRSPAFCAFIYRLLSVHQFFVLLCPDICVFTSFSCVYVQTFGRSPDFRAFISRLRAITKILSVHVQILVLSPDFCTFLSRLPGVHQTFVRLCSDFFAFIKLLCACLLACLFAVLRSENSSGHGVFLFDLKI